MTTPGSMPDRIKGFQHRLCRMSVMRFPPCVYFLCKKGVVVYVGQTDRLPTRIEQHQRNGVRFDAAFYLPVPKHLARKMSQLEAVLIRRLNPEFNLSEPAKNKGIDEEVERWLETDKSIEAVLIAAEIKGRQKSSVGYIEAIGNTEMRSAL